MVISVRRCDSIAATANTCGCCSFRNVYSSLLAGLSSCSFSSSSQAVFTKPTQQAYRLYAFTAITMSCVRDKYGQN